MFTKIMLCTDGSDDAQKAAKAAIEIALKFQSEVTLISAFNPAPALAVPVTGGPGLVPYLNASVVQEISEQFHASADKLASELLNKSKVPYTLRQGFGHPVDVIVDAAKAEQSDLIIMGSRGMGDFKRFLLGSISDGVLHHAHCAVLIVR